VEVEARDRLFDPFLNLFSPSHLGALTVVYDYRIGRKERQPPHHRERF
jgi:hypothetical protein